MRDPLAVPEGELLTHSPRAVPSDKQTRRPTPCLLSVRIGRLRPGLPGRAQPHAHVYLAQGRSAHASGRPTRHGVNGAYASAGSLVSVSTPAAYARAVSDRG